MEKELEFWIRIWTILAIFIAFIAFLITAYASMYRKAVAGAADPIAYTCALDMPGQAVNPTCVIYWNEKGVK